jgi:hypothetical protein
VSCSLVARIASAAGQALAELATCDHLPFPVEIDEPQRAGAAAMWDEMFGGWAGFGGS